MEKKTARLTLLIDPQKKRAFEQLCALQDLTPSQVVRQLIRDYLHKHGVEYETQITKDGKNTLGPVDVSCTVRAETSTGPKGTGCMGID